MVKRKRLRVNRKAHKRKSYLKDVQRGKGVRLKRIRKTKVKKSKSFLIKDIGAVGRGKKVIKRIRKGLLTGMGYSTKIPASERHRALRKADKKFGSVRLFRMLQAQVVLRKRIQPRARKVFVADRNWVRKNLLSKKEGRRMTARARAKRRK